MFRIPLSLIYLAVLFPSALLAQQAIEVRDLSDPLQLVIAQARVSQNKTRVADPVLLTLTVEGPLGLEVQLPESILTKESSLFWRVNRSRPTIISQEQSILYRYEFECAAFTSGDLPLRLAPFKIRRKGGNDTILEFSQPLRVQTFVKVSAVSPEALREPTDIERAIPETNEGTQNGSLIFWLILLGKRPKAIPRSEIWDRTQVLQNWPKTLSAEQTYSILLRYLQFESSAKSGNVMTMISQKPELSDVQKQSLLAIYQQLELERFDPIAKEVSLAAESLRAFLETLPTLPDSSASQGN